jgi:hypothetical protein
VPVNQAIKALGGATTSAITTTTGCTLLACFTGGDGGVFAPSDNKGNSFGSPIINFTGGGARLAVYVVQNAAGGSGHTFQFSGAAGDTVGIFAECTGVLAASLDAAATASGSGAEPFTLNAAATLAQAANTVCSFMLPYMSGDPVTYAANTGYTVHAAQENNNNVYYGQALAFKSVNSTTAPSVQWDTSGATGDVFVGILVLKESGGSPASITGAGNIATAGAFGSPTISQAAATLSPTGIATAGAFGAPTLRATAAPAGVASAGAFGSPTISQAAATLSPSGIATAAAFGSPTISQAAATLSPASIATAGAFGTPATAPRLDPAGVGSGQAFGAPTLAVSLAPAGIGSAEAFGTPTATSSGTIAAAGIASAEAFGSPTLAARLAPAGIAGAEAFGNAVVTSSGTLAPAGVASAEAFGAPTVSSGAATLQPASIASAEALGVPAGSAALQPAGIASTEAVGAPTLAATLIAQGIAAAEAFGTPSVLGDHAITGAGGIGTGEAFGVPLIGEIPPTQWIQTAVEWQSRAVTISSPNRSSAVPSVSRNWR